MFFPTNNLKSTRGVLAPTSAQNRDRPTEASHRRKLRIRTIAAMTVCLLMALSGRSGIAQGGEWQGGDPPPPPPPGGGPSNIKTVFVILMENHNWTGDGRASIKNNPHAPYINDTLIPMASHADNYSNPPDVHPSLPNYLWLEAGTNFGIFNNANPFVNHQSTNQHLVALLDAKGIPWKDYDERSTGDVCPLRQWHNPFVFFDDVTNTNDPLSANCIAHNRPFSELQRDLDANTNVANYIFIVPNLCNSMHNVCPDGGPGAPRSGIAQGDEWLSRTVPGIMNSAAYKNGGALFIVWDEGRHGSDGPIPLLLLSQFAKGNGYSNNIPYTHGSLLRTVEEIFGVTPLLGDAAKQQDLSDLFSVFP